METRTRQFVRAITDKCRIRHSHSRIGKKIICFVVQLEVSINSKWHPVVRYDTAHGVAHRDMIHHDGRIEKTPVFCINYSDSLVFAEKDLTTNWEIYIERYFKEVKKYD